MSSIFTLENIGINCDQGVGHIIDDILPKLYAGDDIPRDRLEALLTSNDLNNSDQDIKDIMAFLDESESKFQNNLSTANIL